MIWIDSESKERFPDPISPLGWSVLQSALKQTSLEIEKELGFKINGPLAIWVEGYVLTPKNFFSTISFWSLLSKNWFSFFLTVTKSVFFSLSVRESLSFSIRWQLNIFYFWLLPRVNKTISEWREDSPKHLNFYSKNETNELSWSIENSDRLNLLSDIEKAGISYNRLDFSIYFLKNWLGLLGQKLDPNFVTDLSTKSNFLICKEWDKHLNKAKSLPNDQKLLYLQKTLGHLSQSWDIATPTFNEIFNESNIANFFKTSEQTKPDKKEINLVLTSTRYKKIFHSLQTSFVEINSIDEEHRFYASGQFNTIRSLIKKIFNFLLTIKSDLKFEYMFSLTLSELTYLVSVGKTLTAEQINQFFDTAIKRSSIISNTRISIIDSKNLETIDGDFYKVKNKRPQSPHHDSHTLSGNVIVSGTIQGFAYWVNNYDDLLAFPNHAILLCLSPSPNWHNAMIRSKGILSMTGGQLSHGAILARERGLPCLTQIEGLETIQNGDLIKVSNERIEILKTSKNKLGEK